MSSSTESAAAPAVKRGPRQDWRTERVGPVDYHVAHRLRSLRMERGLTMAELAGAIGVTQGQIQKYERGDNAITSGRLHSLARVLQVNPGWFFNEFVPDAGLVTQDPLARPRRALSTDALDLAEASMDLTRRQMQTVQAMVEQLRKANGSSAGAGGEPANDGSLDAAGG